MNSTDTTVVSQPLQFVRRGAVVSLRNVPPDRTLLEVLREDLGLTGTKEGCGEGDCGACTVVLGEDDGGRLRYRAVNSCIRLARSVHGQAVWTVEDLTQDPTVQRQAALHPAQQAMLEAHGSQCGFCTPGFVMSLFALYQDRCGHGAAITRSEAQVALSGNLCRCTGYRPILDAAQAMAGLPPASVDEGRVLAQMASIPASVDDHYLRPPTLSALLQARRAHPEAQVVAGTTDVGLWITKLHQRYPRVLDVTAAAELRRIEDHEGVLSIGAAVPLADAFAEMVERWPVLQTFSERFAGLPVRNSGTLGGNVANGSPIGDSMPLLIALGAHVGLSRWTGEGPSGRIETRHIPIEDFYLGYRKTALAPDELLTAIRIPVAPNDGGSTATASGRWLRAYKVSKRFDDDISAVCLAVRVDVIDGVIGRASIGAGGVAATPARARRTEAFLIGQSWTADTVRAAMSHLRDEFSPISDMRASAEYRREVLGNLLWRFWLEAQETPPNSPTRLECWPTPIEEVQA